LPDGLDVDSSHPDISTADLPSVNPSNFEVEAAHVLQNLRTALTEVVTKVPGYVSKPAELQRALQIDLNLSCKVLKVVGASGALAAGPHVPGGSALRLFFDAARRAGVSESVVGSAVTAARNFNDLVVRHAGDRNAFDSMISSLAGADDAAQITLQHRRATFRGQRHIFGAEARTQLVCLAIQPATDPNMLDLAQVTGYFALRQLRPNAPLITSYTYMVNDDGSPRKPAREPLDPNAVTDDGVALLYDFCSRPLPEHRTVRTASGRFCGQLVGQGVGNRAALTWVDGYVSRGAVPRYRGAANDRGAHVARIRIPCETLLLDLLVREDAFGPLAPAARMCAEHLGEVSPEAFQSEILRLSPVEPVKCLGKGPAVLYSADYPRYPELGRYVFDRLGWDGSRFNVYRCRIEYPVLPSVIMMSFELPTSSAG
jgi:hypothetical protein